METIVIKPEKEQKTLWLISWAIPFVLGLAGCIILLFTVEILISSLCLAGWLILMVPIVFWIPAYYRSLEYIIDNDDVKMKEGVFWRKRVTVPYPKITNVDVTQGPVQRMLNIGIIHIQTAGAGGAQGAQAELTLVGIRDLEGLKDTIMERFRGYNTSNAGEVKKEVTDESNSDILRHILSELKAIREALEKK